MNYLLSSCFLFFSALSLIWASPELPRVRGLTLPEVSFQAEKKLPYLSHAYISGQPSNLEDGIEVTLLTEASSKHEILYGYAQSLSKKAIHEKSGRTDSFLVSKSGELLMECYYRRGRLNYPHYQMSITKSHTALALGRAIQLGYLKMEDLDKPVHQLIDGLKVEDFAKGSTTISLDDALKMCSGIRMPKYRILNAAKNGSINGRAHAQALFSLSDPINSSSKEYKYQSADTILVMQVIESVVPGEAEKFIREELFGPMDIDFYNWEKGLSGLPRAAAGSSLRSRDMLKVGHLVLNDGEWMGEQLIPREYLERATSPLVDTRGNAKYGYFWWSENYEVDGKIYKSKQGRGAGGQFLIILPEIEVVAVLTAHNKGMGGILNQTCQALIKTFSN
ncbi:MAG TPA: serine hydrolase [Opitutae bacterium]|nr:serine hydrolase [Opitutae bacterium]